MCDSIFIGFSQSYYLIHVLYVFRLKYKTKFFHERILRLIYGSSVHYHHNVETNPEISASSIQWILFGLLLCLVWTFYRGLPEDIGIPAS